MPLRPDFQSQAENINEYIQELLQNGAASDFVNLRDQIAMMEVDVRQMAEKPSVQRPDKNSGRYEPPTENDLAGPARVASRYLVQMRIAIQARNVDAAVAAGRQAIAALIGTPTNAQDNA